MGYSFKWILEHLSQSFTTVSSSYAGTASFADTASFVTASNVWGPYGSNSVASASWVTGSIFTGSNLALSASYALTAAYALNAGAGGGGTPGGANTTIQFSSGGFFSGSSNFTFISSSNQVNLTGSLIVTGSSRLTGSMFVSGAISASFGANTVGFFGTASWAVSASRATTASYVNLLAGTNVTINYQSNGIAISSSAGASTTVSGIDEYMSRFSGSSNIETASFINRRNIYSFHPHPWYSGYSNVAPQPATGSFIIGQGNQHHTESRQATSIGELTYVSSNTASIAANFGTSTDRNYDFASNYVTSTAPRIHFRGYSTDVRSGTYNLAGLYAMRHGTDPTYDWTINAGLIDESTRLVIFDNVAKRLCYYNNNPYAFDRQSQIGSTVYGSPDFYWGWAITFDTALKYEDGTSVPTYEDNGDFIVYVLGSTQTHGYNYYGNTADGALTSTYGVANYAGGHYSNAHGFANFTTGEQNTVIGSSSMALGKMNGVWGKHGAALNYTNTVGKVYYFNELKRTRETINGQLADLTAFLQGENTDVYDFLVEKTYTENRDYYPVIVIIPSLNYCQQIEIFAYDGNIHSLQIIPNVADLIGEKAVYMVVDDTDWYNWATGRTESYDTRVADLSEDNKPYGSTAIGIESNASNSASFAGGYQTKATGKTSFAFGKQVESRHETSATIGNSVTSSVANSFLVGYSTPNFYVQQDFAAVNAVTKPAVSPWSSMTGLRVVNDLYVDQDANIVRNIYVTGSSFLGNDLADVTRVTGSLLVSNSFELRGVGRVTGSFIISNSLNVIGVSQVTGSQIVSSSWQLIGSGSVTGSLTVSRSLNVIGVSLVTGSNNITGSWQLIGTGTTTGSMIVSNSLNVIGTSTVTGSNNITGSQTLIGTSTISGSNNITGSWQLIGTGNVTGSLVVSSSLTTIGTSTITGSSNITGSQTLVGTTTVTGSNNITGSLQLVGVGTITGSLIVSNSLTTIGTNTTSGSVLITGSSTLIGNQTITGSILITGSAAISSVSYVDFVTSSNPIHSAGRLHWDLDYGTLNIDLNSTAGDEVMAKVGLDNFYYIKNQTGGTLTKGTVIRASGTLGASGRITGAYMIADGTIPHYYTIGVAAETIANGEDGYVYEFGLLRGIQTDGANYGESWSDGDILYVSPSTLGGLTKVEPTAPQLKIQMAIVIKADASNGSIFVRPDLRSLLGDLHNVKDASSTNGDLLVKSGSVWINTKQLTGSYSITGSLTATSFTGSLQGSATAVANSISQGTGITAFSFDGTSAATVAVSGAASLTTDYLTQWNGSGFVDSDIVDQGSNLLVKNSLYISSSNSFRVNAVSGVTSDPLLEVDSNAGIVKIGQYSGTPVAQAGGIYFDGTDWYFGV